MTALALGLEFAGDPRWFYGLTRGEQIRVLAFDRIRKGTGRAKKRTLRGKKLAPQVTMTEEARAWLEE